MMACRRERTAIPLQIIRGDITTLAADAIVNAANPSLPGGGKVGQAKITRGYRLPCRYVIHAVGPGYQGDNH